MDECLCHLIVFGVFPTFSLQSKNACILFVCVKFKENRNLEFLRLYVIVLIFFCFMLILPCFLSK